MSARGYRGLFATYPLWWRLRFEDEALATLQEHDVAEGRTAARLADRMALAVDGLVHRLPRAGAPVFPPRTAGTHRFDQTNGLIDEREPTAFENEHVRWWDRIEASGFVPVGMVGGRSEHRT